MKRNELIKKTDAVINETKTALQAVYDALNQGQQKKLLKDSVIASLFERYNVEV